MSGQNKLRTRFKSLASGLRWQPKLGHKHFRVLKRQSMAVFFHRWAVNKNKCHKEQLKCDKCVKRANTSASTPADSRKTPAGVAAAAAVALAIAIAASGTLAGL